MNSSIEVKIPFHFKGQLFEPASRLDLDDWAQRGTGEWPDLVKRVAQENGIGAYSYELEVMEVSEPVFTHPTGEAGAFLDAESGTFDFEGFRAHWLAQKAFERLAVIAESCLGVRLQPESDLHQALMQAFLAGREERN